MKIFAEITSNASLVVESELYNYFESMADAQYEQILKNITLEELENL